MRQHAVVVEPVLDRDGEKFVGHGFTTIVQIGPVRQIPDRAQCGASHTIIVDGAGER